MRERLKEFYGGGWGKEKGRKAAIEYNKKKFLPKYFYIIFQIENKVNFCIYRTATCLHHTLGLIKHKCQ
jgi:hypothetical protein